ncbi:sodium/proton antiporter (CPA1 family) [Nocardia tenerifensis]|uniref:Sodium/proton antiporter (CPA1 family) n=1 Tax=Nocardia tenerifensis TaxID=228006 RepID=A0A318JX50_9NOCA|nr:Na+/H+ antiporter [Nocardia tenerifensis]PXX61528.1 sodium/proton antiporter (CPA1 family) [Nocardia tenerifensis]
MDQLVLMFVILLAAILAEPLAKWLNVASAVLMTVFGCVVALIPFAPQINIPPHLILPLVLPPLLYAAARRTSWRQFAENWGPIALRAVGLVIATAAAVAAIFHAWYPGLPIAAAVALGAMVAPPDPVAATAVAGSLGLPRRLVVVLGGEGLFNDVTAIVIYGVAIQAVVTGRFSAPHAAAEFVVSAVVAVAVGLLLGWAGSKLTSYLGVATWQVALSLLLPFAAYGLAENWHGSGVLAVLVCALYLTDAATEFSDSDYRLVGDSFWDITEMLISGFAFGLIGLELGAVLEATGGRWPTLLGGASAVVAVVVALRLIWLMTTWAIGRSWWRRADADEPYTWRETIVTWWAGMRGVATVALALAIPLVTDDGADFPGRTEILFTAFVVVLFTLLLQGPTLPLVVRLTGVHADTKRERELERQLWERVIKAELAQLKAIAAEQNMPDELYERLRDGFRQRMARADPEAADADARSEAVRNAKQAKKLRAIREEVVEAGRREALNARREPGMPPDLVDRVTKRLDLGRR